MVRPKVLLFDLGGVLVDFVGLQEAPKLLPQPMDPAEFRRKWVASPALERFEAGRCSWADFARDFIAEWGFDVTPESFLGVFDSWVRDPFPGTFDLLSGLRGRHVLACLSNTNVVHWQRVLDGFGFRHALDRQFASHELGMVKPSPEIYGHVAQALGCRPQEITFFDDGQENVNGARQAGFSAHLVSGHQGLRETLARLGLVGVA
jgi:putative hydrolase of the HAD superfamily